MTSNIFHIGSHSLEEFFHSLPDEEFPRNSGQPGSVDYKEKYRRIKEQLAPYHQNVEKGALLASLQKWYQQVCATLANDCVVNKEEELQKLMKQDPFVYLNGHGPGHIEKVLERVSDLLRSSTISGLSGYETFLLLCAIQFHDVGNYFGREEHEKTSNRIMSNCKSFMPDAFERNKISKIAMVHGGTFNEDKDTINKLPIKDPVQNEKVRMKFLAALLRFGDELADDFTRADNVGLEQEAIPIESIIYHRYSEALHTVRVEKTGETEKQQVLLAFEFNSSLAMMPLKKFGEDRYLLDEIYFRTLKMERERGYCMRFLRPYISIDQIRVVITIQHAENLYQQDEISYTLEEKGYPDEPSSLTKIIPGSLRTGEEEREYLIDKWGRPND